MRYLQTAIAFMAAFMALSVSSLTNAALTIPSEATSISMRQGVVLLADNEVRKEPKKKDPPKDPPALPPSAIPGATNPGSNQGGGNKGTQSPTPSTPTTGNDHCKGSPDCSKTFDGGK